MTRFSRNGQDGVALCPTVKRLLKFLGADLTTEIALRLAQSSHDLTSLALQLDRGESDVCHTLKKMQRFGMVNFQKDKRRHVYSLDNSLKVALNGDSVHIQAQAGDGGRISLIIPRSEIW